MKKNLLLYLSKLENPFNSVLAPTLAWLSSANDFLFDNYYDSYHRGIHFQGGDSRNLETGHLTGGTVCGDRHFEEFNFLVNNFNVMIVSFVDTIFSSCIKNLSLPCISLPDELNTIYKKVFNSLNATLPRNIVMFRSDFGRALSGFEAYLYPEIYYRRAIGVLDSIPENELDELYSVGSTIFCLYVDERVISRLKNKGYTLEIIDRLIESDDYLSLTKRVALRWQDHVKGWILGDPTLVLHWLPKACEENLFSIYSIPQEKIITQFGDFISSKGSVVYGRQYGDRDFFELSKLNLCLQVIDPCRPPFQSVKNVDYIWHMAKSKDGFYAPEFSDEQLIQFAKEGKILLSLMFWSGMIREIANFYNLIDLFAISGLKCGLVLTSKSFEYMMHSSIELLTIPRDQGGVFPNVEPVLGSSGIGVSIESYIDTAILKKTLEEALLKISNIVKNPDYMPRGWWPTMDVSLEKLPLLQKPKPFRFLKYPPYFQFRYKYEDIHYGQSEHTFEGKKQQVTIIDRLKQAIKNAGLLKYFEIYRPYEFFEGGLLNTVVMDAVRATGLQYTFTKAGFKEKPETKYIDNSFIALNYTAGQWDGWTPFETINDVSDLHTAEHKLLKSGKPGWIVSTIDSCLWTFSGEFWKRGHKLFEIAQYCVKGGCTGRLINVKPYTVSRYARIIAENKHLKK